jgi:hypothetical protein
VLLPWPLLLLGLEFPAIMAMLDCTQRPAEHFAGGAADRSAWVKWLVVALLTVPILVGYGIVIGYYYSVVRRNSPGSPG